MVAMPVLAEEEVLLRVYVRSDCPHCAAAKAYLPQWVQQHPGLQLQYRPVDTDPQAAQELLELSKASGYWPPGVARPWPVDSGSGQTWVVCADAPSNAAALFAVGAVGGGQFGGGGQLY